MARDAVCRSTRRKQMDKLDISMFWKVLKARWQWWLAVCGGVFALALAYCLLCAPQYVARCRMLIEPGGLNLTQIQEVYDGSFDSDIRSRDVFIATQIQLLGSDHILAKVFERFGLAEREPFASSREPLECLRRHMEIRQIPSTSLLDIGFMSEDAAFAAAVANGAAQLFMADSRQRASGFSQRGLEKLEAQLLSMGEARRQAIARLNEFKKQSGMLSAGTSQSLYIARLTELDKISVGVQAELASAQAVVDTISQWRAAGGNLDALPESIQNPALTRFKMIRLEAQGALIKSLQDFGPSHKNVAVQKSILSDMEAAMEKERENSLLAAQARLDQTRVRLRIIEQEKQAARRELEMFDSIIDTYRMLEDDLKAAESAYQRLLQRVNELKIASSAASATGGTFQIIVPASPPNTEEHPRTLRILAATLLGAVLLCLCHCVLVALSCVRRESV